MTQRQLLVLSVRGTLRPCAQQWLSPAHSTWAVRGCIDGQKPSQGGVMGRDTAGSGSEWVRVWLGQATPTPPGECHACSHPLLQLMLSSGFGVLGCCVPCMRQALPVGKQGETWAMEKKKPIVDDSQWVHSTASQTATGFLSCPLSPLPQLCSPPTPTSTS